MAEQKFAERVKEKVMDRLNAKGWGSVDRNRINKMIAKYRKNLQDLYPEKKRLIQDEELIVSRGINLDGTPNGKSNYFVFLSKHDDGNIFRFTCTNPAGAEQGTKLPYQEVYIDRIFTEKDGSVEKVSEIIVRKILELAALKKENVYRAQMHFHSRFGLGTDGLTLHRLIDDGISDILDVMRRAMLHNVDVFAYTPHNSIERLYWARRRNVLNALGMIHPIALELTATVLNDHQNGPHHVIMIGNRDAADKIIRDMLNRREPDKMISFFRGMILYEMYNVLQPLRASNEVAMGAAHPVNFMSKTRPVKALGLLSIVDEGQLELTEALDLIRQTDFIECWNGTIDSIPMSFNKTEVEDYIRGLVKKHIPGAKEEITANMANLALGREMEKNHGIDAYYGSDKHRHAPFDKHRGVKASYLAGGDHFGRGWTDYVIPEGMYNPERKLTEEEVVAGISSKTISMDAHIFLRQDQYGIVDIVSARLEEPARLTRVREKLFEAQYKEYAKEVGHDLFYYIANGKWEEVKNIAR